MEGSRRTQLTRRTFLGGLTFTSGAGGRGLKPQPAAAEPPPETDTIRLIYDHDDYSRNRLAFPVRAQEGAEGLGRKRGGFQWIVTTARIGAGDSFSAA
jgi:hypothetical protein